ncbi:UbiA prenyltransferase family protein [Allorhizocola rhizosphaerae]|uniref:UbiA prenyltransferase family protein n=1 Tax=Allorhizocola rhizosphaerae TaxID=1872709 RepID=UPI000E3D7DBF|nr:UbiA prenyltransferase family protein [Allorhizocola rhizosphaerae]
MRTLDIAGPPIIVPLKKRRLRALLSLTRPGQWGKSLLVVPLALLDAPTAEVGALARLAWAVGLFLLASSVVYVFNDVIDRHRDRAHPVKRARPVACGVVSVPLACAVLGLLSVLFMLGIVLAPGVAAWPVLAYLALNVAYTGWWKHVPLLDVFVVATGFVLRAAQGYLALDAQVSIGLLLTVFMLCLLLITGKRRHEMTVSDATHRPSLHGYSTQFLDYLIVMCSVLTVAAFLFHLARREFAAPHTDVALLLSLPFAFFGLSRYLQIVVVHRGGGDPARGLFRDRVLLVTGLLWTVALAGVAWLP